MRTKAGGRQRGNRRLRLLGGSVALLAGVALVAPASASVPARLTGHVVDRIPTTQKVVALTFDGGSGNQGVRPILSTLVGRHVRATFFLTGDFVESHLRSALRIVKAGEVVGNHTMTHPDLTTLSRSAVRAEVTGGARVLTESTGVSPKPWFRFPFGASDDRTLRIVNNLGYAAIGWTIDTLGWEGTSVTSVRGIVRRVRAGLAPGAIILMHLGANPNDGSTLDADALPRVIHAIRQAGYGFTTVRLLLQRSQ